MTTTIPHALDLPSPTDLRGMGLVVKLRELDPRFAEVKVSA